MSDKKRKVPKLRFPGFTDDWEQRKLGEISDKVTEKNRYGEYKETLTNSAEFGIVSQRDFFDKDISNEENLCGYYIVRPGDFVYNPRISNLAPVGPIKRNKLSLTGVMSPLYYVFRVTDQIDGEFLAVFFSTSIWHRFMKLNGDSGARADRFSIKDTVFKMMPLYVPGYAEQKEIGQAFNSLDSLISLHQRKLDNVKMLKKSLLQKLFPKDGEKIPELRFPGFTDDWEQRKLESMAAFSKGCGYSKSDLIDSGHEVILYGRLYTSYDTVISSVNTYVELNDKSVISVGGEVIVPASGESPEDIARASVVEKKGVALGGDLNIIRPKPSLDSVFLALSISNGTQKKELSKRAQGKSVVHLHNSDLKEVIILYPKVEEQSKISDLFISFDSLISLHQRKLDHLKELKKGLLQQMFV